MTYTQHIKGCFGTRGLSEQAFAQGLSKATAALDHLKHNPIRLLEQPKETQDLAEIEALARHINSHFRHVVILGTGGSTLNGQAMLSLVSCRNRFDAHTRIHFMDNVDPYDVECLLEHVPLEHTAFIVISKSGKTLETLAQLLLTIDYMQEHVDASIGKHFFFISDPIPSPMRTIGESIGGSFLEHDAAIGGRFSTFTNVGLLPAAIAGLDIRAIRRGAACVVEQTFSGTSRNAVEAAALNYAFMQQGIAATVLMPYIDRLSGLATWQRQIWAESLGKHGHGNTPIKAMGTLDQHSQLQLYLDGPKDKIFTLMAVEQPSQSRKIRSGLAEKAGLGYLAGCSLDDVLKAEYQATADTLLAHECPVRLITMPHLDEETLGELLMHFALETILVAGMLNINAFDQPAVEDGKIIARQLLEKMMVKA